MLCRLFRLALGRTQPGSALRAAAAAAGARVRSTADAQPRGAVAWSAPLLQVPRWAQPLLCRPRSSAAHVAAAAGASAGVPTVYHPAYSAPQLPPGHRFPMGVFRRIYERLLAEGTISARQVHVPAQLLPRTTLELVHEQQYVSHFLGGTLDAQQLRRIGFGAATADPALIERTQAEVAGTLLTAELALAHGLAVNTAGGTHHAFPGHGSGFCILNDLAVTAAELLRRRAVERVLVLDLDVHQGDGTAVALAGEARAFTLSVHAASNFPARKQASTLDVPLPDGTDDEGFLRAVAEVLPGVLSDFRPDLVLYDAGVDVHADDALGRLSVSDRGMWRRELQVLDTCLAAGVPVAGYMGGGYHASLDVLARRHCLLHQAARQMWADHRL